MLTCQVDSAFLGSSNPFAVRPPLKLSLNRDTLTYLVAYVVCIQQRAVRCCWVWRRFVLHLGKVDDKHCSYSARRRLDRQLSGAAPRYVSLGYEWNWSVRPLVESTARCEWPAICPVTASVHHGFMDHGFNQANSAFHPSRVGKWVVIHVGTWITGVETIQRQIRAWYGCLVAGQSLWVQV